MTAPPSCQNDAMSTHVELTGEFSGSYLIDEVLDDGRLVLRPDTSVAAIRDRAGVRELTQPEWDSFLADHAPDMLPPDGEG
jgi:hypothetical protein